jgi:aminoglycoside phosphotransferase (APT) family kinase protein
MTLTDQSTQVRPGEELDATVIDPYLKAHIPGLQGSPAISQFPGGASNLTYLVSYPNREFVLRRPPFGHKAKSAHDMGREFRILNQLNSGFPYCPKAYVHCTDESLIGGEFYVMDRVKGIILRSTSPPNSIWMPPAPRPCARASSSAWSSCTRSTTTPAAWPTWASLKVTYNGRSKAGAAATKKP